MRMVDKRRVLIGKSLVIVQFPARRLTFLTIRETYSMIYINGKLIFS